MQGEVILPLQGRRFYDLEIIGYRKSLPLMKVSERLYIAYFDSLGDVEFLSHCARLLADRLRGADVLFTSETKGVPLVHEIAKILGHKHYVIARKRKLPFMENPITVSYKPITSEKPQTLTIDGRYARLLEGRRVAIVDDIVSTKETLNALEELVKRAGGIVFKKAAILVEGRVHDDVEHLGVLPLFVEDSAGLQS
ncbi:MAG: phosphoribosyltransferase family protein [Thaumarchaeota archaeon]|nr:phosphoribosyltransferase family protein [Candidatus Calditenuaceae archaeon]MDW8186906.1 phosphoribosyltransferase family protein [Nitrososphaerota archaeon]